MIRDQQQISVSDESEDEPNIYNQQQQMMQGNDANLQMNETAESFGADLNFDQNNQFYEEIEKVFSKFFHDKVTTKAIQQELLAKGVQSKTFLKDKFVFPEITRDHGLKWYPPCPDLYFLPTTILMPHNTDMLKLRDRIIEKYGRTANTILKKNNQQLYIRIHCREYLEIYKIKKITKYQIGKVKNYQHQSPYCLDEELVLSPLYHFYAKNYQKNFSFQDTTSYMLYWAYQKGLLECENSPYLSQWAIKLIVIYYYLTLGKGIPNIVDAYKKDKQTQKMLKIIPRMYKVNKSMDCQLNEQLFHQFNFSLRRKKGFYIQNSKKYAEMLEILTIPYPVSETDVEKFSRKLNKDSGRVNRGNGQSNFNARQGRSHHSSSQNNNRKIISPITAFLKIIQFLHNSINRAQKLVLNFNKSKKAYEVFPDIDFNLEIIHPVFGTNLCQQLTEEASKRRKLKSQIVSVVELEKNSRDQAEIIKKLFKKY